MLEFQITRKINEPSGSSSKGLSCIVTTSFRRIRSEDNPSPEAKFLQTLRDAGFDDVKIHKVGSREDFTRRAQARKEGHEVRGRKLIGTFQEIGRSTAASTLETLQEVHGEPVRDLFSAAFLAGFLFAIGSSSEQREPLVVLNLCAEPDPQHLELFQEARATNIPLAQKIENTHEDEFRNALLTVIFSGKFWGEQFRRSEATL